MTRPNTIDHPQEMVEVERERVEAALKAGKHVVSDNTYLSLKAVNPMVQLARKHNADIQIEAFNVSLEECKRRNAARGASGGRQVPDFIMNNMAKNAYDEYGNLTTYVIETNGRVREVPLVPQPVTKDTVKTLPQQTSDASNAATAFHIDIHGKPAPCQATVQECRRQQGSRDGVHYATYEEANTASQQQMTATYGATSTVQKSS